MATLLNCLLQIAFSSGVITMQKISLFALPIIFTINVACSPSILTERINTSKYPNMVISSEIHAKGNGIKLIGDVRHSIGHYPTHGYMRACATWSSGNRECKERFILMVDGPRRREIGFSFTFNKSPYELVSMKLDFIGPEKSRSK